MTLFRQISLLVSSIFLMILIGVVWSDIHHSRESLRGQIQTVARDMATTLGLAIAGSEGDADEAALETFFNAVFDSGYFQSIALRSPSGRLVHSKSQTVAVEGVPSWFLNWVEFEAPVGQAPVSKGWVQLGTLEVVLHPGYTYRGLYDSLKSLLVWVVVIAFVGLVLLWWLLHWLLKPLRLVRAQADAIHDNQFTHQDELPSTLELRRVVQAMNRMVTRVKSALDEQADAISRYHDLLYRDETTGLANRRAIMAKLSEHVADETAKAGYLILLQIDGLEVLAERQGYARVAEHLNSLSRALEESVGTEGAEIAGRMKKYEFAVFLERSAAQTTVAVETILKGFGADGEKLDTDPSISMRAGAVPLSAGDALGKALADADFALSQAKVKGLNSLVFHTQIDDGLPEGRLKWRALIEQCLDERRIALLSQPVMTASGQIQHREMFVRLRLANGELVRAGVFMPMATDLGLDSAIDREVLRQALSSPSNADCPEAVNLGSAFLSEPAALAQFEELLSGSGGNLAKTLHVEFRHILLQNNVTLAEVLFARLRPQVGALGIDNLDLSLPLELLQHLRPSYVKASASVLADMAIDHGAGALNALFALKENLEFKLIAIGVETPSLKQAMLELGVDGLQGNYLGPAEERLSK